MNCSLVYPNNSNKYLKLTGHKTTRFSWVILYFPRYPCLMMKGPLTFQEFFQLHNAVNCSKPSQSILFFPNLLSLPNSSFSFLIFPCFRMFSVFKWCKSGWEAAPWKELSISARRGSPRSWESKCLFLCHKALTAAAPSSCSIWGKKWQNLLLQIPKMCRAP